MAADDLRDCRVLFKGLKLNISLIYSGVRDLEILNINLVLLRYTRSKMLRIFNSSILSEIFSY